MTPVPQHTIWGREPPQAGAQVLRFDDLGAAVCADGANGLRRVSADEARARGLVVFPGQTEVPLVAYWPEDRYRPRGTRFRGLDDIRNLTDRPTLQGPEDPAPGAILSMTALRDHDLSPFDPRAHFDSSAVAGWVLPGKQLRAYGVELGDLAAVSYRGRTVWCQAYDLGPAHERLELSVEACRQLGIPDCARNGGTERGVSVLILPGSRKLYAIGGRVRPWTAADADSIAAQAAALLNK